METARSLPCPPPGRSGEGLPSPLHRCNQPALPRAALAITPRAAGEAGQKEPLCLPPYYKAQVTSLLGSRNKAKPPQPPAWLSGLERSNECGPVAATCAPAPVALAGGRGHHPAYSCQSRSLNLLPCPSKSPLTLRIQPPYPADQPAGHLPSLTLSPSPHKNSSG